MVVLLVAVVFLGVSHATCITGYDPRGEANYGEGPCIENAPASNMESQSQYLGQQSQPQPQTNNYQSSNMESQNEYLGRTQPQPQQPQQESFLSQQQQQSGEISVQQGRDALKLAQDAYSRSQSNRGYMELKEMERAQAERERLALQSQPQPQQPQQESFLSQQQQSGVITVQQGRDALKAAQDAYSRSSSNRGYMELKKMEREQEAREQAERERLRRSQQQFSQPQPEQPQQESFVNRQQKSDQQKNDERIRELQKKYPGNTEAKMAADERAYANSGSNAGYEEIQLKRKLRLQQYKDARRGEMMRTDPYQAMSIVQRMRRMKVAAAYRSRLAQRSAAYKDNTFPREVMRRYIQRTDYRDQQRNKF